MKMNKDEKFLKVWNNFILFSKNLLKITDKTGKIVPFKLNKMQRDFIKNMDSYNIILKARQGGMSVCICALAIYYAITEPNCVCLLLSHNDESTRAIFNKLKSIYNSIPSVLRPKLIKNNRSELQLVNGSVISCSTMGRTDKGRGNTAKLIHLSEFAFVNSDVANKQLLSLEQALRPDGHLIIETTANGLNFFHNLYQKSKKQENAYKCFFYNYIDTSSMFAEEYKKYKKIFKNINGRNFSLVDLIEEEKELLENYEGMTLDTLCWRRLKIQNSSVDQFNQEFPLTDDMAFITSGNSVFDNNRVTQVLRALQLKKSKYISKKELSDLPMDLLKFYGKSFFIYEKPTAKEKYYIGVDCSEGIGKDSSTCVVLNSKGEEVAMFKNNKIKPYEFASFVNELGRYYNKAFLVVEKASGGHSVIERLRYEYKYMNMYKYKTYDEFNRAKYQIGFDTNAKTKGIIINDLREMFEKGQLLINSAETVEEMKVFNIKDNGSMGTMSGYNDDLVIATALALSGLKSGKNYKW
ncbi:phage terminase large subunit family protein [Clostridium tertium]|uniref:phage terminase large subunit family protein n=1 Tax=Clostridium tertium TaxID=1559 RepID=UPI00356949EC